MKCARVFADAVGDRVFLLPRSASAATGAPTPRSAGVARWLRLIAWASLALISAASPSRAADPCPERARAIEALHEGDEYQAAALLFAVAIVASFVPARRRYSAPSSDNPPAGQPRGGVRLEVDKAHSDRCPACFGLSEELIRST